MNPLNKQYSIQIPQPPPSQYTYTAMKFFILLMFICSIAGTVHAQVRNHLSYELLQTLHATSGVDSVVAKDPALQSFEENRYLDEYYNAFVSMIDAGVPVSDNATTNKLVVQSPKNGDETLTQLTWPRHYFDDAYYYGYSTVSLIDTPVDYYENERDYLVLKQTRTGTYIAKRIHFGNLNKLTRNTIDNLLSPDTFAFYDIINDSENTQAVTYHVVVLTRADRIDYSCETEILEMTSYYASIDGVVAFWPVEHEVEVCITPAMVDPQQDVIMNAEAIYTKTFIPTALQGILTAINSSMLLN